MQVIITATTAFIATNLDDIVVLMLLFSQKKETLRPHQILIGQYLGFAVLILASLPGFIGGLIIPREWIGLLGILPIVIGLKQLLSQEEDTQVQTIATELLPGENKRSIPSRLSTLFTPQVYSVAALTIANGGDNIGIYVPLFASFNLASLLITLIVFIVLIAVWCAIAYQLARFPAVAHVLTRYGHAIVPIVLIGLGIFILAESKSYRLLGLG